MLPRVFLARHGQTAWSLSGQHTGLTDLPLTPAGEANAARLGPRLAGLAFGTVLCSPLQRARSTCALAGFGAVAQTDARLLEWDYGDYEGRTSAEIHAQRPDWRLFRDGCPGGETVAQVAARADSLIATLRGLQGDLLLFSSGHFLRMLAARWLGLPPAEGARFALDTASLGTLGYEHGLDQPVIRLWNDTRHVQP
ncbi:MAG: histidine phosphatase family protein [Burkholderiales bacterium]|nr:histidine phosphatase family protein [Burkholderiales bacterium]